MGDALLLLGLLALVLPVVAIVLSLRALSVARGRGSRAADETRIAALEELALGLAHRVWTLEQGPDAARTPAPPPIPSAAAPLPAPPAPEVEMAPGAPPGGSTTLDLEQRIGARWTTWVGIIVILFGISFFLKWAFDNDYLGPAARVVLGLAAGLAMVAAGLGLHHRRDVPYLSQGLTGGGLAVLYLSLYAGHALYGLLDAGRTFAFMVVVTVLGAIAAVVSSRQITATLTVLGGLLTPVLLTVERPDERGLFAYLLVLDVLVLAVARFRTWPALNRLAWAGTVLLAAAPLLREPRAPDPVARLALLSALFLLFLAVPILRERATGRRLAELDLGLLAVNGAVYFAAVYLTLERWHPEAEAPWALVLAALYAFLATDYAAHVREDALTPMVLEGVSWTFLAIAVPLAFDGRWITLAWAALGVALLWVAPRARTPVALWGGAAALGLAALRVVAFDRYWYPDTVPVWNVTFLTHLLVVGALAIGGVFAARVEREPAARPAPGALRSVLWFAAAGTLAVLLWREPPGLWPAALLTLELVAVAWLARPLSDRAFVVATPLLALVVLARTLVEDAALARQAADALVSLPLLSRVAACLGLALAGRWVAHSTASARAPVIGQTLSGAGAVALLLVLTANWRLYQDAAARAGRATPGEVSWRTQTGLSVLWTLYAAASMAWGFVRSSVALRYGALALFGLTVAKVFLVDLSMVKTVYRILSFFVLGVVLLLVGLVYQKTRRNS